LTALAVVGPNGAMAKSPVRSWEKFFNNESNPEGLKKTTYRNQKFVNAEFITDRPVHHSLGIVHLFLVQFDQQVFFVNIRNRKR
jgi:hypothetical protein